jgi:hypothetical protein
MLRFRDIPCGRRRRTDGNRRNTGEDETHSTPFFGGAQAISATTAGKSFQQDEFS